MPKIRGMPLLGFNPALADVTRVVPRRKSEEISENIINPVENIANEFAEADDEEVSEGGSNFESIFSEVSRGFGSPQGIDLTQEEVLRPQVDFAMELEPLVQELESRKNPPPRDIPEEFSPGKIFLSTFAASMGAQLSRNPQILESVIRQIRERQERRQAIQDQNYVQDLMFNKEKRDALFSLRGKILENQITRSLETGDLDAADKAAKNLAKLKGEIDLEQERIRQAGETARTRETIAAAKGKKEEKEGLEAKDYLSRREGILTADPKKLKSEAIGGGFLGIGGGEKKLSKEDALIAVDATAALMGKTDELKKIGLARVVIGLKKKHGVKKDSVSPKQAGKIAKEMRDLGIDDEVIAGELEKMGFEL